MLVGEAKKQPWQKGRRGIVEAWKKGRRGMLVGEAKSNHGTVVGVVDQVRSSWSSW